jgi:hypothetical protein
MRQRHDCQNKDGGFMVNIMIVRIEMWWGYGQRHDCQNRDGGFMVNVMIVCMQISITGVNIMIISLKISMSQWLYYIW